MSADNVLNILRERHRILFGTDLHDNEYEKRSYVYPHAILKKYGVNCGIMIMYFYDQMQINRKYFYEENSLPYLWVHKTIKEISQDLDFFTFANVRKIINNLKKMEVIRARYFNDGSKWSAVHKSYTYLLSDECVQDIEKVFVIRY